MGMMFTLLPFFNIIFLESYDGGNALNINEMYQILNEKIDKKQLQVNAPMDEHTSFRTGGPAALLVEPKDQLELSYTLQQMEQQKISHIVIGNGSNLLFSDEGYGGVVIKIGTSFQSIRKENNRIHAGAGALLSAVAREAAKGALAGFEFAAGIPGSVGGAVYMNAGAYGGEMVQVLESVIVMKKDGSDIVKKTKGELDLTYRHSNLKDSGEILLEATFILQPGERSVIEARIKELNGRRVEKQPLSYPSAGSFFKRPEGNFAGKLIEDAGLRGLSCGGACVSSLHAGFIINKGSATTKDILDLMEIVRATVYEKSNVLLEPEVRIIGVNQEQ